MPDCATGNKFKCPENVVFYSDVYNGLINLTSSLGVPIFNSFNNFYKADPILENSITVYNKDKSLVRSSDNDLTYVKVEKNTGVTTSLILKLQGVFNLETDRLFNGKGVFLPIFKIDRGANMT